LTRAPEGVTARLIHLANAAPGPILAVDLPSGLDATSGEPFSPTVRTKATLTLALPKRGLLAAGATTLFARAAIIPLNSMRGGGDADRATAGQTTGDEA